MDRQTPCGDFSVAGLPDHLVGSIAGIGKALGVAVVEQPDAAPEVRVADAAQPPLEAFQAHGLDGTIDMGFAELPATTVANILNLEFLVHAWDFATATGRSPAARSRGPAHRVWAAVPCRRIRRGHRTTKGLHGARRE
ncbi:MAG TPA: hypothetical protein DDY41_10975 [Arthrobacter bacterium]|jgi:uncharacterized protein (TIGR03086 family)|nr:hypothetical protein [Arthrobacter sp.]